MKTKILSLIAASSIFCGCITTAPTPDNVKTISYSVGYTAGVVANQFKTDDTTRNEICSIMTTVKSCVPQVDQTFNNAWTPIAQEHTQKLVSENKITAQQATLILKTFNIVTDGIDYLMNTKFKDVKIYADLTEIAVHNFVDGFLTVYTPANVMSFGPAAVEFVDKDTYEYLMSTRNPMYKNRNMHKNQKRSKTQKQN